MSTRFLRPTRTGAAAAVLAAGLTGLLAGPAAATPTDPAPGDYSETIELSWDGSSYAATTTESFLGTPVAVPGDSATRTLLVRNDGPTDATLRATIIDVQLLDPGAPDVHHNPEHVAPDDSGRYTGSGDQGNFYDDLQVGWGSGHASMTQLAANDQTQILQIPLAQGSQVPITIDYELPLAATSGNQANVSERLASFDVLLELGGNLPTSPPTDDPDPDPGDDPSPDPGDDPSPDPGEEPTPAPGEGATSNLGDGAGSGAGAHDSSTLAQTTQPQPPALPDTGADLRWPALGVAVLLALGGVLVFAARRREDVRHHH